MATAGVAVCAARQVGPHPTRRPLGARAAAARLVDGADGRRARPADDARHAAAVERPAAASGVAEHRRGSTDPGPANLSHRASIRNRSRAAGSLLAIIDRGWFRFICEAFAAAGHRSVRAVPVTRCLPQAAALDYARRSRGNGQRGRAGDSGLGRARRHSLAGLPIAPPCAGAWRPCSARSSRPRPRCCSKVRRQRSCQRHASNWRSRAACKAKGWRCRRRRERDARRARRRRAGLAVSC